ncbi:MAG: ABC transporter ATP-binding protein/permease [Lachnospiraceae bacterium]|nr:ABC transporter ATP-binding protein/permease [Lachnospiraceae bacterium]
MATNSIREDEDVSTVKKSVTIKRLLSYLFVHKKTIVAVMFIMAYCVGVSLVNPLIIESCVDDHIAVGDIKGMLKLMAFALVLNIVWVILVKVRMYIMSKMTNSIIETIRDEVFTHLQTLGFKYFDSRPTGKILSRVMGDVNSLKQVLQNFVITLLPDFITVLAVMVIMIIKNPRLALAGMVGLPLLIVGLFVIEALSRVRWQTFRKKASNLNAFLHEDIAGIRIVKTYTAEEESLETFDELTDEHKSWFIKAVRINDCFNSTIEISTAISIVCMLYVAIKVLHIGAGNVGLLIAFTSYLSLFWQPIANLGSFYNQIITNLAAAERVFDVIDTEPEIKDDEGVTDMPAITGNVSFRNVGFAYEDEVPVLKDVNFDITPGETIALVGPTGAGKTTIVNLISRFYDVQSGKVLIDGNDVKKVSIHSLRSQLGIMTQDNYLFTGTIKDNIRYGKLDATDEEIEAACKAVNAHDFIMRLEKGYDTELTERGGNLSAGQKQLLAFARTIISDPKILILDEATSSIDTKSELLVQKGIEVILKGRTSFVIAHRLSTIRNADRIFVIENGGIAEEGDHEALMNRKGLYYNLIMAQQC